MYIHITSTHVAPCCTSAQVRTPGNCRSTFEQTTKYSFCQLTLFKLPGTYCDLVPLQQQYFTQFFVCKSIMYVLSGIANYVKMSNKTCILPLRYLNLHTVAILCTILYVVKYIYKIKKELCESEQWKYLNLKSALTLYKFEVKSLHSVRSLHCFPSHMHIYL